MFTIVQWNSYTDVSIVFKEDGAPAFFLYRWEAERYAKENLNFNWQVIHLD